jgi:hypothetical protein
MSNGFSKVISARLIGKMIEVYTGDEFESLMYSEYNTLKYGVVYGKLIEVDEECIILEVTIGDKTNLMYMNSWQIKTICEPKTGMSTANMIVCVTKVNNGIK